MAVRRVLEQQRNRRDEQREGDRPPGDGPDRLADVVVRIAEAVAEGHEHEGEKRRQSRRDRHDERPRVLLARRAIGLDPVQAVERPLHLAHQRGARDDRADETEDQTDPLAARRRGPRLTDRLRQHFTGGTGDRALHDARHDAAEAGVPQHRRQADEADDPFQQHQRDHERE